MQGKQRPGVACDGGSIADGTYVLTKVTVYATSSVSQQVAADSLRFAGNVLEQTSTDLLSGMSSIWKYSYVASPDKTIVFTCLCTQQGPSCASANGFAQSYSATAMDVTLYDQKYSSADPGNSYGLYVYTRM